MSNNLLQLVLFVGLTCSSTLLWRIETSPPSYLFGTIHVFSDLVWPYTSNETRQAFMSSTHVYAELDAKNDAYWDDFLRCLENKSTRTRRSTDTSEIEILDIYLLSEARRLNKTVGSLESAEYHCETQGWRYSISTWKRIVNFMKKEMLIKKFTTSLLNNSLIGGIFKKYICDELNNQYFKTLNLTTEYIQHMEQRDEQMAKHIHSLLHYPKNYRYFFAIGAAHMLGGHQNVIVRLESLGYKITRICTDRNRMRKKIGCRKKKIMKHCIKKTQS